MNVLVVAVMLVLIAAASVALRRGSGQPGENWDAYLQSEPEGLAKLLSGPAKAVSTGKLISSVNEESLDQLRGRLRLGGAFHGDLNVYLSYQAVALLVSAGFLSVSMLSGLSTFWRLVIVGLGVTVALWPYSTVRTKAKERADSLRRALPDFAELLLMVLPSMSVPQALTFTSSKLDGPVAVEMRELVRTLSTRSMPESQAFDLTSERLGTPEGRAFVSALKVAYLDGAKAVDPIRAQVDVLRQIQFQHQRALAKKLPVTLVVNFDIHFMPMLFILAFLPVFSSLSGVA